MKSHFHGKILIVLAVAFATASSTVSRAQDQPGQPPQAAALPAGVMPGSPLADVMKMVQAGVDVATLQGYVANAQSPFNLDADKILSLKDLGVPNELINAMMDRDKALAVAAMAPPPTAPVAPPPAPAPPMAPPVPDTAAPPMPDTAPPAEVTINYFQDNLSPYGTWMNIDGYGQCWRPTAVIYDTNWRPYCDRGHWVYTDYGWYWDSDYAWGIAFHYGRWFHHARFGWCWYPDNVWAPSWVTWRSGGEYCGWAPLPPFAVFNPGGGFYYRGASVGVDFDFGLGADCFVFLSPGHLCDRRPRSFCVESRQVTQIFRQTTVINNYNVSSRTIVNRGIGLDRITSVTHRNIEPVHLSTLPNAVKQGWRGENFQQTAHTTAIGNNHPLFNNNNNNGRTFTPANTGNNQLHNGEQFNHVNNSANTVHYDSAGHVLQGSQQSGYHTESYQSQSPSHVLTPANPGNNQVQNGGQFGHVNNNANTVHYDSAGHVLQGTQQGGYHTDAYQSQSQNHGQFGGNNNGQSQTFSGQPQMHQSSTYNNTYNAGSQNTQTGGQPSRFYNNNPPVFSSSPQHGSEQLQQRQVVPSGGSSEYQQQQHNSGGGAGGGQNNGQGNGQGNGANNGNTRGLNKQNQ